MASVKNLLDAHRMRWILGGCVLVTLIAVRPLLAVDISGTWDLSCRIGPEQEIITLELVQDGSRISGMGFRRMEPRGNTISVAVRGGSAHSGDFHFFLVEPGQSGDPPQEFRGSWFRDEMSGLTVGAFGERMFTGVRRRPRD